MAGKRASLGTPKQQARICRVHWDYSCVLYFNSEDVTVRIKIQLTNLL